eukprot:scaffold1356_cov123-Cylindrotheca_fusiformis.AAC.22
MPPKSKAKKQPPATTEKQNGSFKVKVVSPEKSMEARKRAACGDNEFKDSKADNRDKVQICVEYLQEDFVYFYIMKTSKDGFDEEGFTAGIFSRKNDMNEMGAKWGIGYIGYRRGADGRALLGKHPEHIPAGKRAWPWKAMVANANAFDNQNEWLETLRDKLNEESKGFRFESPPFVLRLLNKRDDENKRKLQDVLTDRSVMEYVVGYYELDDPIVCKKVLKYGVETVVPIESIYTEDKTEMTKKLTDFLSAICDGAGKVTTDESNQSQEEQKQNVKDTDQQTE